MTFRQEPPQPLPSDQAMEQISAGYEPGDLDQHHRGDDGPLGNSEPLAAGSFLLGVFVLCVGFWVLVVLTVRWLI